MPLQWQGAIKSSPEEIVHMGFEINASIATKIKNNQNLIKGNRHASYCGGVGVGNCTKITNKNDFTILNDNSVNN